MDLMNEHILMGIGTCNYNISTDFLEPLTNITIDDSSELFYKHYQHRHARARNTQKSTARGGFTTGRKISNESRITVITAALLPDNKRINIYVTYYFHFVLYVRVLCSCNETAASHETRAG